MQTKVVCIGIQLAKKNTFKKQDCDLPASYNTYAYNNNLETWKIFNKYEILQRKSTNLTIFEKDMDLNNCYYDAYAVMQRIILNSKLLPKTS